MNIRITKLIALFALAAVLILPDTALAQRGDSGGRTSSRTRGGGSGSSAALQAQSKVLAVADERSNSLIIIAAEDQIAMIEELINELDDNVDDLTEVRVIKLENADPTEMADQINELFGSSQNSQPRFGPTAFFGRGGGNQNSSERGKRSTQEVVAIADPRTASLIISAPLQMIGTVEALVKQLDSNSAKRQKVFIYTMEYADVNNAAELLRTIFEGDNTRTTQTQDSALRTRSGSFGSAGSSNTTGGARGGGSGGIGGR